MPTQAEWRRAFARAVHVGRPGLALDQAALLVAAEERQDLDVAAYLRQLDQRELTFKAEDSRIYDEETGSNWNIAGAALDGPLKGQKLTAIPTTHCLWFGWWATYPDSVVYKG